MKIFIFILFLSFNFTTLIWAQNGQIELPVMPPAKYKILCISNVRIAYIGENIDDEDNFTPISGLKHHTKDFNVDISNGLCHHFRAESPTYNFLMKGITNVSLDKITMTSHQIDTDLKWPFLGSLILDNSHTTTKTNFEYRLVLSNKDIRRHYPLPPNVYNRQLTIHNVNDGVKLEPWVLALNELLGDYPDSLKARIPKHGGYIVESRTAENDFKNSTAISQTLHIQQIGQLHHLKWDIKEEDILGRQEIEELVENLAENVAIARQQAIANSPLYDVGLNGKELLKKEMMQEMLNSPDMTEKILDLLKKNQP